MPIEQLRELMAYDPDTGALTWLQSRHGVYAGRTAGAVQPNRYWSVMIDRRRYQAHRLGWFLMTGEWPAFIIDHIDGDGGNNRWSNLRRATAQQNGWNSRGYAKSGYKGVYPTPSGKWTARIKINGRIINYPSRETPEEAHADYCEAARVHHGAFARVV